MNLKLKILEATKAEELEREVNAFQASRKILVGKSCVTRLEDDTLVYTQFLYYDDITHLPQAQHTKSTESYR